MKKTLFALTLLLTACGTSALPETFTYEGATGEDLPYAYSFRYPSEFELNELTGKDGETISLEKDGTLQLQMAVKMVDAAAITPSFMEQEPTETIMIQDTSAQVYEFPEGLCNGDQCSPPANVVRFWMGTEAIQQFLMVDFTDSSRSEYGQLMVDTFEASLKEETAE